MNNSNKSNTPLSRLSGMLGLCRRAGKTVTGVDMVCDALRSRKPPAVVFTASDCSKNTAKKVNDKCTFYKVPCRELPLSVIELSDALGKSGAVGAAAVTDKSMAEAVLKLLNEVRKNEFVDPEQN